MQTTTSRTIRLLRRTLGQTQGEFAVATGVSKDAVASWETGRNDLSAAMARRISLATGVDDQSLLKENAGLRTLELPRRPYTRADFERHQRTFWGGDAETNARQHARRCGDTLELLFAAAAGSGGGSKLGGVLGSFIQWANETRELFELEKAIDAQLARRPATLTLTKSYGQWRELTKADPALARRMRFKDDAQKGDEEPLTLSLETVPAWAPGWNMRGR